MNPKVFMSFIRVDGDNPRAATAMDGSASSRFSPLRMAVLDRMVDYKKTEYTQVTSYFCGKSLPIFVVEENSTVTYENPEKVEFGRQ